MNSSQARGLVCCSHVPVGSWFWNALGYRTSSLGDLSVLCNCLGVLSLFHKMKPVQLGEGRAVPRGGQCPGGTAGSEIRARCCGRWEEARALSPVGHHVACFYFQGVWGDWYFLFVTHWSEAGEVVAGAHLLFVPVCRDREQPAPASGWFLGSSPRMGFSPGTLALQEGPSLAGEPRLEASDPGGDCCGHLSPLTGVSPSGRAGEVGPQVGQPFVPQLGEEPGGPLSTCVSHPLFS